MFLRFSEDTLEEIQKQIDAMIEDIDTDKDIITATADVGKVHICSNSRRDCLQSKKESKDQEWIQSSTTPVP